MRRALVSVLALFAVGCANSGRTPLPPPFSPPPAPVELEEDPLAKYPELLLLPGRIVRVRYAAGTLDRAEHFRLRLDGIAEAVAPLVRGELPLVGVVLDREGWEKSGIETAWGLPARTGALAFTVGSDGDPDTVALAKALTGGFLPALPGEPLLGTADEASSQVVADALLQVDVGRGIVEHLKLGGTDPWITEILAHLVARLGWEATDPGQMPAIADLFDRMFAASPAAPGEPESRSDSTTTPLPCRSPRISPGSPTSCAPPT